MNSDIELIKPDWPAPESVVAFSTTRSGGCSQPPYDSLNLACHVGDDIQNVNSNRQLLRKHLPNEPTWLNQTHSAIVKPLSVGSKIEGDCDGTYTFESNVVCTVMTADCLPVLLTDQQGSFVAAVHAGWRGLASGIISHCLKSLNKSTFDDVLVWLGPAIGAKAFEVGSEVRDIFIQASGVNDNAFVAHGEKWLCDIYQLAKNELSQSGIAQVYGGKFCTFSDKEHFFSYRRDGQCGRMAHCIFLNEDE